MTDLQWDDLLAIINRDWKDPLTMGFLVDGPWVSQVIGASLMDYVTDREVWLKANLELVVISAGAWPKPSAPFRIGGA